jgi:hypothetical protein
MRKAKTLLAVYLAYMLEYRAELFLWALAGLLPLILMGVWTEAARSGGFPSPRGSSPATSSWSSWCARPRWSGWCGSLSGTWWRAGSPSASSAP